MRKVCSCGVIHTTVPETHKVNDMGVWWDCSCQSTLWIPHDEVKKRMEKRSTPFALSGNQKGGSMSFIADKVRQSIDYLKQEIKNMEDEMDRTDSFDTYRYDLRKRLMDLQVQLEHNENLLESLDPSKKQAVSL